VTSHSYTTGHLPSQAAECRIQDWKLDHYSRLYGSGKLTLARAAREARVSLWEMMDYVKTKKITAQYDLEDFQRDLKTVAASERR
jgi:predicted HTH domain antitoxin